MAIAVQLTGDWLTNIGNKMQVNGTANLGTYATSGVAVSANNVGLGVLEQLIIEPAGGYTFEWVKSTGKIKAYATAGFTPAGTVAAPTFTGTLVTPSFTVQSAGAIGVNMEVGLSADSAAATFEGGTGITAPRTLTTTSPVGAITPAGTNSAPAFTGTAVAAAAGSEVANAVSLAGVTFRFTATGY